ncbi:MAG: transcriptional regulator [Thiotrichales bacterium]|nr:MAG: transcriptional regulator [Thiotrichales bacterium]
MEKGTENIAIAFGFVLREQRTKAGLSQEKLALECGLDRTYISLLERGQRQPTLSTLFRLAKILDVDPSVIVQSIASRISDA